MDITRHDPGGAEGITDTSDLRCQTCGAMPAQAQGYMSVMSFLFLTRWRKYGAICRSCATRTGLKELAKSATLGWWGIPWGLIRTFEAVFVDVRALSRWSNLGAGTAITCAVLALAIPVTAIVLILRGSEGSGGGGASTNRASEAVVDRIERGHKRLREGKPSEALKDYEEANRMHPGSSVINDCVGEAYLEMGRPHEALPWIAEAERIEKSRTLYIARHGWLLAGTGDLEGARKKADLLKTRQPGDAEDAWWMGLLYRALDRPEDQLRAATEGLAVAQRNKDLDALELEALLKLNRQDEFDKVWSGLWKSERDEVAAFRVIADLGRRPLEALPAFEQAWAGEKLGPDMMALAVHVVEAGGKLEETRARIRAWLGASGTPADAWGLAAPWFTPAQWPGELDAYLVHRTELTPGLMRLQSLRDVLDHDAILALGKRLRALPDPRIEYADMLWFRERGHDLAPEVVAEFEAHVRDVPSHHHCATMLAGWLAEIDPVRSASLLGREKDASAADPSIAQTVEVGLAELDVVQDHPAEARMRIEALRRRPNPQREYDQYANLVEMEAAFASGDLQALDRARDRVEQDSEAAHRAAALLIRWCDQIARKEAGTYAADVRSWLEKAGSDVRNTTSTSAQAILFEEGRVDQAWSRRLAGKAHLDTFRLVHLFKNPPASDAEALALLKEIGASRETYDYAPRLAREVLKRRGAS